jgi:Carboxypeptidase regulatory-like domain
MHRAALAPAILLVTSALAMGQQAADPAPDRAVIEGAVINARNGRAIPRATVVLRDVRKPTLAKSVRADGAGHFVFKDVDPSIYRLSADRQSFFSDLRLASFQSRIEVAAGDHRTDVVVRLVPAAVVTGEVVDEHSEPMQHVQVKLLSRAYRQGRMVLDAAGIGLTDDRGTYRIYDVRPGHYYVLAEITPELQKKGLQVIATTGIVGLLETAGTGEAPPESDVAFSPLFFPDTTDFLEAQALPVGPGDEVHAGFIFMTMPSVSIKGKITNGITGAPAENPTVSASWTEFLEGTARDVRVFPKDGSFEVRGLAPGFYTLRASFAVEGSNYTTQQTVAVGPNGVNNVLLIGLPDSEVTGGVVVDTPSPTDTPVQRISLEFRNKETAARSTASTRPPTMQFQTSLHPGDHYTVVARGLLQDYYLKAVRISGHEMERNDVVVSDRRSAMELVLSPNGGHITGLVFDDKSQPVTGSVVLLPEEAKRGFPDLFRKTGVDRQGAFTLPGVPPGTYLLLAFDDIDLNELMDHPELLKQYAEKAQTVIVAEKGAYSVPLQLIHAGEQ